MGTRRYSRGTRLLLTEFSFWRGCSAARIRAFANVSPSYRRLRSPRVTGYLSYRVPINVYVHVYIYTHAGTMFVYTYIYIYIQIDTCIHTYIHTYIYIYMYVYIRA